MAPGEAQGPRGLAYQLESKPILEALSRALLLTQALREPGPSARPVGSRHSPLGSPPSKAGPVWITLSLLILLSMVKRSPPQGGTP